MLGLNKKKGFTLLELLLTITIVSILTAIAVPSFNTMISHNNIAAAQKEMRSSLQLARTMAISRGSAVYVVAATGGYSNGWAVTTLPTTTYADCDIDSPLSVKQCLYVSSAIQGLSITEANNASSITFSASGQVTTGGSRLIICDQNLSNDITGAVIELSSTAKVNTREIDSCAP